MKKSISRIMAAVMAVSMVFSVSVVSKAADESETLTAAAAGHWSNWANADTTAPRSKDYPVGADGTLVLYVEGTTGNDDIVMEFRDENSCVTAHTQGEVWPFPTGDATCKTETLNAKGLCGGVIGNKHMIKITIKSTKSATDASKKDFTMDLYDTVDKKTLMAFSAVGSSISDAWNFHIICVYGGVKIYATAPQGVDTTGGGDTQITATPSTTDTNTGDTKDKEESTTAKKTMKLSGVKAKKGSTKVTGKVSVKKATVKVKVGKKKYKKAKVSGKKFTFKCAKLKKGTKVKIQVTKKNYKTVTKTVKVK